MKKQNKGIFAIVFAAVWTGLMVCGFAVLVVMPVLQVN